MYMYGYIALQPALAGRQRASFPTKTQRPRGLRVPLHALRLHPMSLRRRQSLYTTRSLYIELVHDIHQIALNARLCHFPSYPNALYCKCTSPLYLSGHTSNTVYTYSMRCSICHVPTYVPVCVSVPVFTLWTPLCACPLWTPPDDVEVMINQLRHTSNKQHTQHKQHKQRKQHTHTTHTTQTQNIHNTSTHTHTHTSHQHHNTRRS